MAGLGSVTLNSLSNSSYDSTSYDESICGMLFDCGKRQEPFEGFPIIEKFFDNGQTVLINNMDEAAQYGIEDNDFLSGIVYYHLKSYYDYIGKEHPLYISIANCLSNGQPDFSCIEDIQREAKGQIFQLGIWTEQCIWCKTDDGIGFTSLLGHLQSMADILCGKIGEVSNSVSPLNIIVSPCTSCLDGDDSAIKKLDHRQVPNAIELEFPKLMVILGQNGSDEVHRIQANCTDYTPVGSLGFALACCTLNPAEESIGSVEKSDLNKNDDYQYPELGFGNLGSDIDENDYRPFDKLNRIRRNILSTKGYVLPTIYKAKEAGVYFSNDQTLSEGDYRSLSNNRIIHKCRRLIKIVMLPYTEESLNLNPATGGLATADASIITSEIVDTLDKGLLNKNGQSQIGGKMVDIDIENNILETDQINIDLKIVPLTSSDIIHFRESYILSEL